MKDIRTVTKIAKEPTTETIMVEDQAKRVSHKGMTKVEKKKDGDAEAEIEADDVVVKKKKTGPKRKQMAEIGTQVE